MKKTLFILLILGFGVSVLSGCEPRRAVVHNRNGHVRHVKVKRNSPWYTPAGSGYSRHTSRKMRRWDRHML